MLFYFRLWLRPAISFFTFLVRKSLYDSQAQRRIMRTVALTITLVKGPFKMWKWVEVRPSMSPEMVSNLRALQIALLCVHLNNPCCGFFFAMYMHTPILVCQCSQHSGARNITFVSNQWLGSRIRFLGTCWRADTLFRS